MSVPSGTGPQPVGSWASVSSGFPSKQGAVRCGVWGRGGASGTQTKGKGGSWGSCRADPGQTRCHLVQRGGSQQPDSASVLKGEVTSFGGGAVTERVEPRRTVHSGFQSTLLWVWKAAEEQGGRAQRRVWDLLGLRLPSGVGNEQGQGS